MAKIALTTLAILILVLAASPPVQALLQEMQCRQCLIGCGVQPIPAHSSNNENFSICSDAFGELLRKHGGGTVVTDNPRSGISGDKYSFVGVGTVENTTSTTFSYELAKGIAAVAVSCQYCVPIRH